MTADEQVVELGEGLSLIAHGFHFGCIRDGVVYRVRGDIRVSVAAQAWDASRRDAIALRAARNAFVCDNEPHPNDESKGRLPCWKDWEEIPTPDGMGVAGAALADRDEWCEPCRKRQDANAAYREATKRRGVAMRSLQRALRINFPAAAATGAAS